MNLYQIHIKSVLIIVGIILGTSIFSYSQVVLQLERFNSPVVEKYYPGQKIHYKTKALPDDWKTDIITEIKDKEQLLVFENGYIAMNKIIAVRKTKPIMKYMSNALYVFGINWFFWGGVATLRGDYDPGWDTVAIGGFAIFGGWIFRKFYYKTTPINGKNRLRILDISWPDPTN